MFHENRLLAYDSHEISYLIIFSKIRKVVAKFVICCSHDWCFKGYLFVYLYCLLMTSLFNLCRLLMTFANSLDPYQARKNAGPDLDSNCLALGVKLK